MIKVICLPTRHISSEIDNDYTYIPINNELIRIARNEGMKKCEFPTSIIFENKNVYDFLTTLPIQQLREKLYEFYNNDEVILDISYEEAIDEKERLGE